VPRHNAASEALQEAGEAGAAARAQSARNDPPVALRED
jgi:hypothetical protein